MKQFIHKGLFISYPVRGFIQSVECFQVLGFAFTVNFGFAFATAALARS